MSEKSQSSGVIVAVTVILLMMLLMMAGGGALFLLASRQRSVVIATEMAREQEALARAQSARAHAMLQQATANTATASAMAAEAEAGTAEQIESVLRMQERAWNDGKIDEFMEHYWKSEDLTFSSGGKTTRSWNDTRQRYREKYSTPEKMGKLSFRNLKITPLNSSAALVLGEWRLERDQEPVNGNFTLVMQEMDGKWVIVHDHTSRLSEE